MRTESEASNGHLLNQAQERLNCWYRQHSRWQATHWIVGITGIVASALAAAENVTHDWAPICALISTLCLSVIAFLNPQVHAERYIAAWRVVYSSRIRYEHKNGESDADALINAITKGELIIQGAEERQKPEPSVPRLLRQRPALHKGASHYTRKTQPTPAQQVAARRHLTLRSFLTSIRACKTGDNRRLHRARLLLRN